MRSSGYSLLLLIVTLLATVCEAQQPGLENGAFRFWTDSDDRRSSIKLRLVELTGQTLKLKREDNGEILQLRMDQLSRVDQEYARAHARPSRAVAAPASPSNWTRYRGPNGTGVAEVTGLPVQWSESQNVRWKCALPGPGLSSPVVWQDNVYVTCFTGFAWPKEHEAKRLVGSFERHLVCVDLKTGEIKWHRSDTADHFDRNMDLSDGFWQLRAHGFASNTPTCDARGVYAFFAADGLFAFSHDGEPRWSVSCGQGHDRTGSASSPIADGGRIYVSARLEGSSTFAIDAESGEILWRQHGQGGWFDTPVLREYNGRQELLVRDHEGTLKGLNPMDGAELWANQQAQGSSKVSLVCAGGKIFSQDGDHRTIARDASGEVLWQMPGGPYFGTPAYYDGRLYFVKEGIFSVVDAESGETLSRERLPVGGTWYASPVIAEGRVYCVSREDGVCVMDAAAGFQLLAHNKLTDDDSHFDGTPALTNAGILLRSDNAIYCIADIDE